MSTPSPVCVTVYVTCPNQSAALEFAKVLVTEKLAACGNVVPGVTSVYEWEGHLETATETALLLKTIKTAVPVLMARIQQLHPYETPCIVVWEIIGGGQPYLDWVAAQVRDPASSGSVPGE